MLDNDITCFFSKYSLKPESLLVGISGGRDSVALLCMLRRLRDSLGIKRLSALHINHGLRGEESERDQEFVKALCNDLSVELFVQEIKGLSGYGIEEKARRERYRVFSEFLTEKGFDSAATAHTRDDQAETVLMRVLRGTGVSGLRGIHPVRDDRIIRPFVFTPRSRLTAWLKENSIEWLEDSSNSDTRFKRNLVRHEILPVIERCFNGCTERIASLSERAAQGDTIIEEVFSDWFKKGVEQETPDRFSIKKALLTESGRERREELARTFRDFGIEYDNRDIDRVFSLLDKNGKRVLLKGGWTGYSERDVFEFEYSAVDKAGRGGLSDESPFPEMDLSIPGKAEFMGIRVAWGPSDIPEEYDMENKRVWIDVDKSGGRLFMRPFSGELVFRPLGWSRPTRLKSFVKKLKRDRRGVRRSPVTTDSSDRVVWMPGVALSNDVRVDTGTSRVAELHLY